MYQLDKLFRMDQSYDWIPFVECQKFDLETDQIGIFNPILHSRLQLSSSLATVTESISYDDWVN